MSGFDEDIKAQGEVLREVLRAYHDPEADVLRAARAVASGGSPVIFTGMGSSLSAVYPAVERLAAFGRPAVAREAGELLYYGATSVPPDSVIVLISQSGRSAETLAVGELLRRAGGVRILALVNDTESPIAQLADAVLPMRAGDENAVATKTFVATFIVAHALTDTLSATADRIADLALEIDLPARVTALAASTELGTEATAAFIDTDALVILGRGPLFATVDYGALILKEIAAFPSEPMFGGSFRHGPIEIAGPRVGAIVLASHGPTQSLGIRLASETARLGSPTWLLTTSSADGLDELEYRMVVTRLPDVPEALAPLLYHVPLQHFARRLALGRGREPGVFLHSSKVTVAEG